MSGLFEGISATSSGPSRLTSGESRVPTKKYARGGSTQTASTRTTTTTTQNNNQNNGMILQNRELREGRGDFVVYLD
jgi:hypothetical protein